MVHPTSTRTELVEVKPNTRARVGFVCFIPRCPPDLAGNLGFCAFVALDQCWASDLDPRTRFNSPLQGFLSWMPQSLVPRFSVRLTRNSSSPRVESSVSCIQRGPPQVRGKVFEDILTKLSRYLAHNRSICLPSNALSACPVIPIQAFLVQSLERHHIRHKVRAMGHISKLQNDSSSSVLDLDSYVPISYNRNLSFPYDDDISCGCCSVMTESDDLIENVNSCTRVQDCCVSKAVRRSGQARLSEQPHPFLLLNRSSLLHSPGQAGLTHSHSPFGLVG
jgi:hypothetical protein